MPLRSPLLRAAGLLATFALGACGSGDAFEPAASDVATVCTPLERTACSCDGGHDGERACRDDGTGWDTCACPTPDATTSTSPEGAGCGDGFCDPDEDCHGCTSDCGTCAQCTEAPACVGDVAPPGSLTPDPDLNLTLQPVSRQALEARVAKRVASADPGARLVAAALARAVAGELPVVAALRQALAEHPVAAAALRRQLGRAGMADPASFAASFPAALDVPVYQTLDGSIPEGGNEACGAPKVRVRASAVRVNEEDDDVANDIVFCILAAEAPGGSEVRLTPRTDNLDEGQSFDFGEKGTFWGQVEPRTPDGDLTLTYDCFEEDSTSGYDAILDKLGLASTVAGVVLNLAGGQGWIFSAAGTALSLIGEAVALDGDDHLFSATQTIAPDKHLALTNGTTWKVHRSGTHLWSDWDWELSVEAWGCAEYGAATQPLQRGARRLRPEDAREACSRAKRSGTGVAASSSLLGVLAAAPMPRDANAARFLAALEVAMKTTSILLLLAYAAVLGTVSCAMEGAPPVAAEPAQVQPRPKPIPPNEPKPAPAPKPTHTGDPPDAPAAPRM